jgi:hypothetical protein
VEIPRKLSLASCEWGGLKLEATNTQRLAFGCWAFDQRISLAVLYLPTGELYTALRLQILLILLGVVTAVSWLPYAPWRGAAPKQSQLLSGFYICMGYLLNNILLLV